MKSKLFYVFCNYIKRFWLVFLISVFFIGIIAFVLFLSDQKLAPFLYGVLLCATFGAIFLLIDFVRYYVKYRQLWDIRALASVTVTHLPPTSDLIEKTYQEIIQIQNDEKNIVQSNFDSYKTETTDYYTMWVHQIKTPIAAMRLLLQLENSPSNGEISAELFKTEQYVEMVLQYIRMQDLSNDLVLCKYNLNDIIRQSVRKYSKLFIIKKIALEFSDVNYMVLTDKKWLGFIIDQLLSNAIKYTNKGKISIYMDKEKPNTLVMEDTGIGINDDDMPRIFEKGYTGYNGRMDKKSTGLGLYLCKNISDKLGHRIYAASTVGVGTKIYIDFSRQDVIIE